MRAVPCRYRSTGGGLAPDYGGPRQGRSRDRARASRGRRRRHAGRVDLWPRPDGVRGRGVGHQAVAPLRTGVMKLPITLVEIGRPVRTDAAPVTLTIDDQSLSVPAGSTILEAAAGLGVTIPTLCYLGTLSPANVCRLCVVR